MFIRNDKNYSRKKLISIKPKVYCKNPYTSGMWLSIKNNKYDYMDAYFWSINPENIINIGLVSKANIEQKISCRYKEESN